MKKLILKWLFGIDDVTQYVDMLGNAIEANKNCIERCNDVIRIVNEHKQDLDTIRKLIRVCENHGIDVDEEIKKIKLYDMEK